MRLIAAAPRGLGRYLVAAQIKLAGSAVTYWRTPGDAGVPPSFSFEGSENLAAAKVAYPAPSRLNEQGLEAFGYRDSVIFPIEVTARDPKKPVHLHLKLDYAVCDNICLPARGAADLVLPQKGASDEEKILAQAVARVPIALIPSAVEKDVAVAPDPAAKARKPRWILTWAGARANDLFAEAPDGWDVETHPLGGGRFVLTAMQQSSSAAPSVLATRLTLTTAQRAYVFTVNLALPARASALRTK